MSGGEQQMLAIGRALMSNPRLLLLDEPAMGLAPVLVERIYETIAEINRQGTTILLVEQNANFALDVSNRGYVLETGHRGTVGRVRLTAREPRGPEGVPGRMTVFALLGAKALWLTYIWLASAIASIWLSDRKGYGEKPGLATGLILSAIGVVIWLLWPARAGLALEGPGTRSRGAARRRSPRRARSARRRNAGEG